MAIQPTFWRIQHVSMILLRQQSPSPLVLWQSTTSLLLGLASLLKTLR